MTCNLSARNLSARIQLLGLGALTSWALLDGATSASAQPPPAQAPSPSTSSASPFSQPVLDAGAGAPTMNGSPPAPGTSPATFPPDAGGMPSGEGPSAPSTSTTPSPSPTAPVPLSAPAAPTPGAPAPTPPGPASSGFGQGSPSVSAGPPASAEPENPPATEPFAFGNFTWLNGESRQHKSLLDTPIFTGQLLLDLNYTQSRNNPIDNTVVGSTAISRNNELTIAFVGVGGDFHYEHARGRLMTQFGVRSILVARNDFSTFHGQFDLQNALRYISEANGGYHWDVLHGINLDLGIFMSYVGLFSFDNFENWMYLPSYTSDNTPWFFNGARIQIFPTDTLKIEPWIINGWQTYAKFNEMPGFGSQILFRPVDWFSVLSNWYLGWDAQDLPGLFRWHTDTSLTVSYYHDARTFIKRVASSYTFDLGGENGDGVSFAGNAPEGHCTTSNTCPARFVSGMMYHRVWFSDQFAITAGGGFMSNPSRYLVLSPTGNASPIPQPESTQGLQYVPASQPFDLSLGTHFNAWDYSFGFQYMPIEEFTLDVEWNHRQADVPYFAGHGGVTSPDGYVTTPIGPGWRPDLVKSDDRIVLAWLVRF